MGWKVAVRFSVAARNYSFLHGVHTGSEAHPVSHPIMSGALSQRVKWLQREADHFNYFQGQE
jgi:hypothetical protein